MKALLAILATFAFMVASVAAAQTCDMNMSMTMSHKGAVKLKNAAEYKGLTAAEAQDIVTRSMAVLNEASKGQDKRGGDYTFGFDGTNTCGTTMAAIGPIDGLTHKDAVKVWRQAFKVADATIKKSEAHVAKGGKGPWGKD